MLAVAKSRRYLLLLAVSHQLGSFPTGTCEKVASDLWLGDGFRRVLLHQLQSASHDLAARNMAEKVTKIGIPKLTYDM